MDAIKVTVRVKLRNIAVGGAYATVSSSGAQGKGDGLSAYTLPVDYFLDKQVTAYTYYSSLENNKDAKGSFDAAEPKAFGIGIRYNI